MPPMSSEDLAASNLDQTIDGLLEELRDRSAQELMDDVYRHFHFIVCRDCKQRFLDDPLGTQRAE